MEHLGWVPDAQKVIKNMAKTSKCPMHYVVMSGFEAVQRFCALRRAQKNPGYACMECETWRDIQRGDIPDWITLRKFVLTIDIGGKDMAKIDKCIKCGKTRKIAAKGLCKSCYNREWDAAHFRIKTGQTPTSAAAPVSAPALASSPKSIPESAAILSPRATSHPVYSTNPDFDALLRRMGEIHDAKRKDYANDDNPLGNFEAARMLGISPVTGILVRMTDKFTRACNLARPAATQHVRDESIEDTLIDLANYALLAVLSRRRETKEAICQEA